MRVGRANNAPYIHSTSSVLLLREDTEIDSLTEVHREEEDMKTVPAVETEKRIIPHSEAKPQIRQPFQE